MNIPLILYQNKFNYIRPLLKRLLLLIFILLCANHGVLSQSYPFRHFTTKDGLPTSEIYHVFQDSKGYIWFATDNGVSRYDGYEFKNFTTEDGLPDNTVFEIYQDYKNRIWFIPHSAQFSYFENDSIIEFKHNNKLKKHFKNNSNPHKRSFMVDSTDRIIYGDRENEGIIIDSFGNINIFKKSINVINKFLIHENDIVSSFNLPWDRSQDIFSIEKDNKELFILPNESPFREIYNYNYTLAELNNNDLYIGSNKLLIHLKDLSTFSYKIVDDIIIWLNTDTENNIWIGTRNGAYCYNSVSESSKPIHHFLKGKNVSSILKDKEGGSWFTTLYNGVYYLPNIYTENLDQRDSFPGDNVNTIASDSVHIWIGLESDIIGLKSKKIDKLIKLENSIITKKLFSDIEHKKLWIGSSGIYCYNGKLKKQYILDLERKPVKGTPSDYLKDSFGNIWAASHAGLIKYNKEMNTWVSKSSVSSKINSITLLGRNSILVGSNNGLWEYSIPDNSSKYLGEQNGLLSIQINCIINNPFHNNFWLGTKAKGVVVYDSDTTFNISTRDGLSNDFITSLYFKDSAVWATTVNGLNKITFQEQELKTKYKIETFNTDHGLASNEINDIYISDSAAYIGTKEGLTIIDYNKIKPNDFSPPIYIKHISVQNNDTIIQKHYNLSYNQNSIHIEYAGLMYRNNENKKYKYQLNHSGQKATWIETPENNVSLSFLSPGKYMFKVIAINEDGYHSSEPATFSFTIKAPYWKTWWFISLIVLVGFILILAVLYAIYKIRIREINRRNALEKKLMQEINKFRQQALSQQMNPHFLFNTLNAIQYYIFENDNISSAKYLAKFSRLMRLILDNSQYDTISISKELDALELYMELESLRTEGSFDYEIKIDKNLDTSLYHISPMLIQPYVENSIWHGITPKKDKGKIKIEFLLNPESLVCIVEDNGIGRKKAIELKKNKKSYHRSLGTNITSKRIEIINKLYNKNFKVEFVDLKDENGIGCGTKVILHIPKILNKN